MISLRWPDARDEDDALFDLIRERPDRRWIKDDWIVEAVEHPDREIIQPDGRVRRWKTIAAAGGRSLRVILLADGETVHNAFFDRGEP